MSVLTFYIPPDETTTYEVDARDPTSGSPLEGAKVVIQDGSLPPVTVYIGQTGPDGKARVNLQKGVRYGISVERLNSPVTTGPTVYVRKAK